MTEEGKEITAIGATEKRRRYLLHAMIAEANEIENAQTALQLEPTVKHVL